MKEEEKGSNLRKKELMILRDLVKDKINRTEWVLKNKKKGEIWDKDLLHENLEGYKELLARLEEILAWRKI